MSSSIKSLAFLALATGLASVSSAQSTSGSGTTTRYWYAAISYTQETMLTNY
jgi:hypothetical protein